MDVLLEKAKPYVDRTMEIVTKVVVPIAHKCFHACMVQIILWQQIAVNLKIRDDTKIALVVGLLMGVVIIIVLSYNPGEPFDYFTGESPPDPRNPQPVKKVKVEDDDEEEEEDEGSGDLVRDLAQGATKLDGTGLRRRKKKKKKKGGENGEGGAAAAADNDDKALAKIAKTLEGEEGDEASKSSSSGLGEDDDPFNDEIINKTKQLASAFGLNSEQFEKAVMDAKEQYKTGEVPQDDSGVLTFWANSIILTFLFGGLAWAINHDYNGAFTKWFIQMFPNEAGTLGLIGSG